MRFGLFTLFDHYPEDQSAQEYYQFLIDEIVYAEQLGFDSVWLGEHHFCDYLCPSPPVFAAAVAQRTKRIRIGTAAALPALADPVRMAEEYAMLDVLSNGRVDFGVGRGFQTDSYHAFNKPMDESRELLMEAVDFIDKAWTADGPLTYKGRYREVDQLPILPQPVQKPRPPIWMAGSLSPESYQFAGEQGFNLMMATVFSPLDKFIPLADLYREKANEAGHDLGRMRISVANHCYVGTSSKQAKTLWEKYYMRYIKFFSSLLDSPAYRLSKQHQAFTRLKDLLENISFNYATATMAICGDAQETIDRVAKAHDMSGNTDFWIYTDLGGLPREEVFASLKRFAEQVMPKFR